MGIKFYCPNGHKMNVKVFLAGQRGICPRCGVHVEIPLASTDQPPPAAAPVQAARAAGSPASAPAKTKPVFGMLVDNQSPPAERDAGQTASVAHSTAPGIAPVAPTPQPEIEPDSGSGSTPQIGILRWTTDAREPFGGERPETLPGAAHVHQIRRRSKREKITKASLIMLGVVAVLGAVLLIMLLSG